MMQDFVDHLKALFDSLFASEPDATPRGQTTGEAPRNHDEGHRELREYELYYWSAAPGPWY